MEFLPTFAASYPALFCDLCVLSRLLPFRSPEPGYSHPAFFLRFLCLFAAIPVLS